MCTEWEISNFHWKCSIKATSLVNVNQSKVIENQKPLLIQFHLGKVLPRRAANLLIAEIWNCWLVRLTFKLITLHSPRELMRNGQLCVWSSDLASWAGHWTRSIGESEWRSNGARMVPIEAMSLLDQIAAQSIRHPIITRMPPRHRHQTHITY